MSTAGSNHDSVLLGVVRKERDWLLAENQQLRAVLDAIANRDFGGCSLSPDEAAMRDIALAALAGTPSEDTE